MKIILVDRTTGAESYVERVHAITSTEDGRTLFLYRNGRTAAEIDTSRTAWGISRT